MSAVLISADSHSDVGVPTEGTFLSGPRGAPPPQSRVAARCAVVSVVSSSAPAFRATSGQVPVAAEISYHRHRSPPVVIQHAVWLYLRFTLSYRDVEELLAECGLDISYETVRSWVMKFGPVIARRLRRRRCRPSDRWHLDEMVIRIAGKRMYLWRAVDHEGEVRDILCRSVPSRRHWST